MFFWHVSKFPGLPEAVQQGKGHAGSLHVLLVLGPFSCSSAAPSPADNIPTPRCALPVTANTYRD